MARAYAASGLSTGEKIEFTCSFFLFDFFFFKFKHVESINLQIQQDFKELYPGREDGLISKWDSTKEVLINLLNAEIAKSDEYGRKLLTDLTATDIGIYKKIDICDNFFCYRYIIYYFILIFVFQTKMM